MVRIHTSPNLCRDTFATNEFMHAFFSFVPLPIKHQFTQVLIASLKCSRVSVHVAYRRYMSVSDFYFYLFVVYFPCGCRCRCHRCLLVKLLRLCKQSWYTFMQAYLYVSHLCMPLSVSHTFM